MRKLFPFWRKFKKIQILIIDLVWPSKNSTLTSFWEINNSLIPGSSEFKLKIQQILLKTPINQDIKLRKNRVEKRELLRVCLAQKVVGKTCIAPDRLVRKGFTNLRDKICDLRLIFWSERLPTKQGQTCDIVRLQFFYNFVNRYLCKLLPKLKIPSLSIKASRAGVMTATHKKRDPESRSIGSIHCFYRSVVHFTTINNWKIYKDITLESLKIKTNIFSLKKSLRSLIS